MPLVSVIVPTRNSSRTLESCLKSISAQSLKDLELIVVDNFSSDATLEIAGRYADICRVFGRERSAQRNHGADFARGEYLFFVDSDMWLEPTVVAECLNVIRSSGAAAVVVPEVSTGTGFWARCKQLERSCYSGDDLIEAARFFARSSFEAAAGFDQSLIAGEDWDLSIRVASGARLPRVSSRIIHDEGRLRIGGLFEKKKYYASSFRAYWRKHPAIASRQANLIFRVAFLKNWRSLISHPILTGGIFALKLFEACGGLVGFLFRATAPSYTDATSRSA